MHPKAQGRKNSSSCLLSSVTTCQLRLSVHMSLIQKSQLRAGKTAQWGKALAARHANLSFTLSTYMVERENQLLLVVFFLHINIIEILKLIIVESMLAHGIFRRKGELVKQNRGGEAGRTGEYNPVTHSLIHEGRQILPHLKAKPQSCVGNEVCDSLQFGLPPFHDVAFVTNTNKENKGLYTVR